MRLGTPRIALERLAGQADRVVVPTLLQPQSAEMQQRGQMPGVEREDRQVELLRLAEPPRFVQRRRLRKAALFDAAARRQSHGNGSLRALNAIDIRGQRPRWAKTMCGR